MPALLDQRADLDRIDVVSADDSSNRLIRIRTNPPFLRSMTMPTQAPLPLREALHAIDQHIDNCSPTRRGQGSPELSSAVEVMPKDR